MKVKQKLLKMKSYSFKRGFDQVPVGVVKTVKSEIMAALGITTHPAWLNRLRGTTEPKVSEAQAIENVFKSHGIKEVWGE